MSKFLKVMIVLLTIAAVATPAMAELKLNGYFRTQMITEKQSVTADKSISVIDQRFRLKMTYDLNENVKWVYYTEVDTPWGQAGSTPSNGADPKTEFGGKAGADGVNIETKNIYLDVKIPNSIFSTRIGVQGFGAGFDGALFGQDMAGIQVNAKIAPTFNMTAGYFKFDEGANNAWDDTDLYAVKAKLELTDTADLSFIVAYIDDNGSNTATEDEELYYLGAKTDLKAGAIDISAALAFSGGTHAATGNDIAGYTATAKVSTQAGPAKIGARVIYYSSDDDATDGDDNTFNGDAGGGAYEYYQENSHIFLTSAPYNNTSGGRHALNDAAYSGHGLFGLALSANMKYDSGHYAKFGAGYFMALEDTIAGDPAATRADKDLGFEVSAQFGTKIAKKVDVSLTGAYAVLGDFYKGAANDDELYKVNLLVNVPF